MLPTSWTGAHCGPSDVIGNRSFFGADTFYLSFNSGHFKIASVSNPRTYDQYCPVAVALDVLGDRWTLLVVRELLLSPVRYSDLQRALPGISPNLLSERLQELERTGLVVREELPPPAARTVYALTDEGRQARGVVAALARFGMGHLTPPDSSTEVRPAMAVYGSLRPFFDASAAVKAKDHYRLVLNGKSFDLSVVKGRLADPPPGSVPNLVLEMAPHLLVAARVGKLDLSEAARKGQLRLEGDRKAFDRFLRVFALGKSVSSRADV